MTDESARLGAQATKPPSRPVGLIDRVEGGAIAVVVVVVFVLSGFAWWWLLALFIVFDVSMVGYAINNRVGAICYNLVHNYAVPVVLLGVYAALLAGGITASPIAVIAGCWIFHVGVDRALGFGPRPLA